MTHFSAYRKAIEGALQAGNATEHTHRPALKALVEALAPGVTAVNEPRRVQCGAPDYIVTRRNIPLGYIEAKDVGVPLTAMEQSAQLARYLSSLGNLILTDYLEFRWYVGGEHRMTARLATEGAKGKLRLEPDGEARVAQLLQSFLAAHAPTVGTPKELAVRMANLAHLLRDALAEAFAGEDEDGVLHQQLASFRQVLLHDLKEADFADMYAQTICYGLFAARCNRLNGERFTRYVAPRALPKTNPFLRRMFSLIAGPDLDDEPFVWVVDDLADLLDRADIAAILKDFGRRTRQEDPVVHFYETFLAAYDPRLREARGVYYTPEPVVSYIVHSVDSLLKTAFGLPDGLADASKVTFKQGEAERDVHRVQILDPATGTGTFLHGVIDQVHAHQLAAGQRGAWNGYVSDHLLPRLYGFELLMAPYAVAHMKLGLQLAETGYDFHADERLRIYLTNTLEEPHDLAATLPFAQWLAEEANAASEVKRDMPILVVLGNPPYSGHSANTGNWIRELLRGKDTQTGKATENYFQVDGQPLKERNPKWLNDDYVKFIRFAQWRIERTGHGILAFISNNGYLDNPTFRGMRRSLMKTFDDIYILDLHGNSKKRERAPDGGKDENVFDIQQGVAIGIFVKRKENRGNRETRIHHAHAWGTRGDKYARLGREELTVTEWQHVEPRAPSYLFTPQDEGLREEYERGVKVTEMMPVNSAGIVTARDSLTIRWSEDEMWSVITDFTSLSPEVARSKYRLGEDVIDWKVEYAQRDVRQSGPSPRHVVPILYRVFDQRYTYFTGYSRGFQCRPREEVMQHMLADDNIGLSTTRSIEISRGWEHVFCTNTILDHHAVSLKEVNYLFPLYLYPDGKPKVSLFEVHEESEAYGGRRPNLSPEFIAAFAAKLEMAFVPDGKGDRRATFGPEDVFDYMYAVFHSPAYRQRYAEFLKIDFPRLPLTGNADLFRALCARGEELVGLHLLERPVPLITRYPVEGDNIVKQVRYTEPRGETPGRVWINDAQYIEGVPPDAWAFHVGGYQVCEKWLKDRKGRLLSYDEITHYQQVVAALHATLRLMGEIDAAIAAHGGWPLA